MLTSQGGRGVDTVEEGQSAGGCTVRPGLPVRAGPGDFRLIDSIKSGLR